MAATVAHCSPGHGGPAQQAEELRLVLRQLLVAHLLVSSQDLDYMKGVFNLGTDAGLGLLDRQQHHLYGSSFHYQTRRYQKGQILRRRWLPGSYRKDCAAFPSVSNIPDLRY